MCAMLDNWICAVVTYQDQDISKDLSDHLYLCTFSKNKYYTA